MSGQVFAWKVMPKKGDPISNPIDFNAEAIEAWGTYSGTAKWEFGKGSTIVVFFYYSKRSDFFIDHCLIPEVFSDQGHLEFPASTIDQEIVQHLRKLFLDGTGLEEE